VGKEKAEAKARKEAVGKEKEAEAKAKEEAAEKEKAGMVPPSWRR
jgi:hypothetical protein